MSSSYCPSENYHQHTVQLHKVNYIWTIDNFSSYENTLIDDDCPTSPIFSALTDNNYKWYLLCMPYGKSGRSNDIGVFLRLSRRSKSGQVCTEFSIHFLNEKQEEKRSLKISGHVFDNMTEKPSHLEDKNSSDSDWGWLAFLKKNEIFKNEMLIGDRLTISCKLSFFEINERNMEPFFHPYNFDSLQHLSKEMKLLRRNATLTDVVISVSGKDYPAHKCMLSARSKVFAAMFRNDTMENRENRVEVTDMTEEVMEEFLSYIYSGTCENVKKLADDLLVVAEKYDTDDLKRFCEESLYEDLTIENAPSMLVLADTYHAKELKSKVLDFIVAESSKIVNSAPWNNIMPSYPTLINEVCVALSRRGSAT